MTERVWKWRLPTGETVIAKLDLEKREESILLGPELVSRGELGAKPEGHAIPIGSEGGTAYRGAREVRAIFDDDGGHCRLLVDGNAIASEPRDPTPGPPLLESEPIPKMSWKVSAAALFLILFFTGVTVRECTVHKPPTSSAHP